MRAAFFAFALALALALALAAAPLAQADAIPGPHELSPAQEALIGTWQQSEQASFRSGHGESRSTLIFDEANYIRAELRIIGITNSSESWSETGTWTGRETGEGSYEITLSPAGGSSPQVLIVKITGPQAMALQLWQSNPNSVVPFQRIFPL